MKLTFRKIKNALIGKARDLRDPQLFHKISLIAFFAWVGLGSDGISSSCYGPEETFLALGANVSLGIFVALASAITIFVISSSYSQIIELFPHGGGGYLVASRLLSPSVGMVSGCALLIDYVLTITISIASGADALFSFLPPAWYPFRLSFAVLTLVALMLLNMRGVKESILPLVPIFLTFIITHAIAIIYALITHLSDFSAVAHTTVSDIQQTSSQLGMAGMLFLIMRAYSMGAGTYTGIEAVSNGIPILREPRVETAKKAMRYMAFSLSFMVVGLMLGYLLYKVQHQPGKTLNAVFFENVAAGWGSPGYVFVLITLFSEAVILFVAAQTGFLGGPRVLANMAQDRWFPFQFALLSERFVAQNGVLLMGGAALILMVLSGGSVKFLVVLYAINVFITFFLSQLGMVRYWWRKRHKLRSWVRRFLINGIGLVLTAFILVSVMIIKFHEGGWITLFITGSLIMLAITFKRYYNRTLGLLKRLDSLTTATEITSPAPIRNIKDGAEPTMDLTAKTAVIMVNGFNGMGLHTLFNVIRIFGDNFKNFFFIEAGIIDAGHFKGVDAIGRLEDHVTHELNKYVTFMKKQGFYAEGFSAIGTDVVGEINDLANKIFNIYPQTVFFGGQIVFAEDTLFTKMLYNYTTFAVQRRLHQQGIPFIVMPIRVS